VGYHWNRFHPPWTLREQTLNEFGIANPMVRALKYNAVTSAVYKRMLRARAADTRAFVFVATTGRSGSQSLARIFDAVDGAVCHHEPHPVMGDTCPPGRDRGAYFRHLFRVLKAPHVLRDACGHKVYVETNHQFVKRFAAEAVQEFGDRLRVIHLRRDPVPVATSFYRIDSVPGRTKRGRLWLLDPADPENRLPLSDLMAPGGELDHDLYRCLWYWYETEARILDLRRRFPHVPMPTLDTAGLNDADTLAACFRELDIPLDRSRLDELAGTRLNTKKQDNHHRVARGEAEVMNERLQDVIRGRFGDLGAAVISGASV